MPLLNFLPTDRILQHKVFSAQSEFQRSRLGLTVDIWQIICRGTGPDRSAFTKLPRRQLALEKLPALLYELLQHLHGHLVASGK